MLLQAEFNKNVIIFLFYLHDFIIFYSYYTVACYTANI